MDNSSLLKIAYNDFIEELFGENLGDVTQRMVTRKDYKQALQKINKKYQLEQGHPKFIEWTLILLARSPRFIDNQSNQRRPTCSLPDEWKPKYTQDLISKLKDPNMVSICGEWVIGTLSSSLYWNHLRRRLDFLAFAIIEEGRTNGEMCPRELDPITADSLFSYLVEPQIKKSSKFVKLWLVDKLFRMIVLDQAGGLIQEQDKIYHYFTAPYFTSSVYGTNSDIGKCWLDELSEEIFRKPLNEWIGEIRDLMTDSISED